MRCQSAIRSGGHDQVDLLARARVPVHDPLGDDVYDDRDEDESCPGADAGGVGVPDQVRRRRSEVTVLQVIGTYHVRIGDGGAQLLGGRFTTEARQSSEQCRYR